MLLIFFSILLHIFMGKFNDWLAVFFVSAACVCVSSRVLLFNGFACLKYSNKCKNEINKSKNQTEQTVPKKHFYSQSHTQATLSIGSAYKRHSFFSWHQLRFQFHVLVCVIFVQFIFCISFLDSNCN